MTPRKNRPVLYELISRNQRTRTRGFSPRPPAPTPGATTASGSGSESGTTGPRARPFVGFEDGALCAVLSWPYLVGLAVVLILLLAGAYRLGVRSGRLQGAVQPAENPPTPTAAQAAEKPRSRVDPTPGSSRGERGVAAPQTVSREEPRPRPPEPKPPAPQQGGAPPAKPADDAELAPGFYYVIVQHFSAAKRADAEAARDFLRGPEAHIECVLRQRGPDIVIVATQRFDSERTAQALVQKVTDAGKQYWKAGGGYKFQGAYALKL
ncbi:MAG: hypothetical protein AB1716_06925 [Planctomycetota bacterium]